MTASNVRRFRLARGLRLVDLAARSGLDLKTCRKAERGAILRMTPESLLRVSVALGVGPADLWPVLGATAGGDAGLLDSTQR